MVWTPARAVRVRRDLEAEQVGGIDDRLHLRIAEMRFQPAALLRQHAAGRGNLDKVGAVLAGLPHLLRAFDCAGAGKTAGDHVVDFGQEAAGIAVPADNRDGAARGDDARAGHHALRRRAAQRLRDLCSARAQVAHRGEARFCRQPRVLGREHGVPFGRVDRRAPVIAARIARDMRVQVDQARHDRLAGQVHALRAVGRGAHAILDRDDASVGDGDRRGAGGAAIGIADHRAGVDHHRIGQRRAGQTGERGCRDQACKTLHWPPPAIQRSIFASRIGKGSAPVPSTCWWKRRMSKRSPSRVSARSRSSCIFSAPTL